MAAMDRPDRRPDRPPDRRIDLPAIERAAGALDPVFADTPQFVCTSLNDALGVPLAVKVETINPVRSFKGRGAHLLAAGADPAAPLVCASAGNFGLAMAFACRARGLELTVHAAENANALKVRGMRRLGARVVLHGRDFDAAKAEARRAASEAGWRFIEDGLEVETLVGAGTLALEWFGSTAPCDTLLVPLGNGALLAGVATVVRARHPEVRIVAVQSAGAPAMTDSLRAGRLVTRDRADTIADGIAVRMPIARTLEDLEGLVDDTVLVGEETIVDAMRLLHEHVGAVVEPAGAVGVAALLEEPEAYKGAAVGTVLTGGNLTAEQMRRWL